MILFILMFLAFCFEVVIRSLNGSRVQSFCY